MRHGRLLPAAALLVMALWAIGFIAAVLRDNQLPGDMALGAVVGAVLLPVFFAACVLVLVVWPLVRAWDEDPADEDRPLTNER
jgi:hypothetical protein